MARAQIETAVEILEKLYVKAFSGKRNGRFVLTRDQVADALIVEIAQDKTIARLSAAALNDAGLVLSPSGRNLYSVVSTKKANAWRRVPKAILREAIGPRETSTRRPEDDESDEAED